MSSDDFKIPELPSDEELGIAGLSEDDLPDDGPPARTPPPKGPSGPAKAKPPAGPRSRWRGPVTLAALMLMTWALSGDRYLPGPRPANAPDTAFSSGRAMATLVELARAPHPVGSPEHARVRDLVEERLRELGLDPQVQVATSVIRGRTTARAATVRNVLARIPGTASTGAVLLTAHYDAVPLSSGAGDDGTGVVTILETLRALGTLGPMRNDLIVLITDAEELGLLGARAFVAEHPWMADVRVVLSVEMRGGGGPSIMFETGSENGWIVQAFGQAAPHPFANAISVEVYRRLPNDTDFSPFRDRGVQGLNFAAIDRARVYHQAADVPGNIQEATIQHHGANLLAVARYLGDTDLGQVDAPDRAYLTLPVVGVVSHPRSWSLAASAVLALLAILAFGVGRARGARMAGVGVGVVLALAAGGITAAAGWGMFRWVRGFHPEYGALVSAFHEEGWYMLALVAAALAVVTALFGLARRRFGPGSLALGALLIPLLGAAVVGFVAPLAAPNLQWPVAAALVAAGLAAAVRAEGEAGVPLWLGMLLLAVPVLAVLVPLVEFVWVAMSIALAPVLGAMVVVALLLMVPALDGLGHPNRWWTPALALVVAAGLVGVGVLRAGTAPSRPAPSTLLYLLDRDAGTSRWAAPLDGDGASWARERTGTPLETEAELEAFRQAGTWRVSPAPAVDAPPPSATVRSDTVVDGRRRLELAVLAPLAAEGLTFQLPGDSPWQFVAVNGRELPPGPEDSDGDGVAVLEHWGIPQDTLTVTLAAPAGVQEPRLHLLEQMLRPELLVGVETFERPDTLMPNARRGSDRALLRTPILVGAPAGIPTVRTDSVPAPVPDTAGLRPPPDTVGDTLRR